MIGSHLDTVPSGGMFDGALGMIAGLECARVIQETGVQLPWNLEIINFSDEEAAYNAGTVGSRATKRDIRAERTQNSLIILVMQFLHECPLLLVLWGFTVIL